MKDVNYPLQKAYLDALSGIVIDTVTIPVYYQQIPNDLNPDNYILFSPIINVDISPKTCFQTESSMQVIIYTYQAKGNTGKTCGLIVNEIMQRIYTKPSTLQADGVSVLSTKLESDTTNGYSTLGVRTYVERRLVFNHIISHNG